MVHTTVHFSVCARFLSREQRVKAVIPSRPDVGSSKNNSSGTQIRCSVKLKFTFHKKLSYPISFSGQKERKLLGLINSSMATHSRFLSPPEIPLFMGLPTRVFLHFSRPSLVITSFTWPPLNCMCVHQMYVCVERKSGCWRKKLKEMVKR